MNDKPVLPKRWSICFCQISAVQIVRRLSLARARELEFFGEKPDGKNT
jgi:hypothetical protein